MDIDITEYEKDPEPFGSPWAKPRTKTACRVESVGPHPSVSGPPGFETVLSIGVEMPERRFELCIDEKSARFLAGAIDLYLKPFQSSGDAGTPSPEAANPSV